MSDFESYRDPYRKDHPEIDAAHKRERVRQIKEGAGFTDTHNQTEIADSGKPAPKRSAFEPVGYYEDRDDRGAIIRFTVHRMTGHPRFERVVITGAGEDRELWLVDGLSWPTRGAAEARLKVVEDVGVFCLGSPAWRELQAHHTIHAFELPKQPYEAGDPEGRID